MLTSKYISLEPTLRKGLESNVQMFNTMVEQPIVMALQCSNLSIALELIKRGAVVDTMTSDSPDLAACTAWKERRDDT